MDAWLELVLAVFSSVLASSGLWAYFTKRAERKDSKTEMLIGLAHDRIITLGMSYVNRGWISYDEYENLNQYLYEPYKKLGGNGSAARVMAAVDKLEIRSVGDGHEQGNGNSVDDIRL